MKQTHGYEVNYADQRIVLTKKFAKAASVLDSTEYRQLLKIRHDFPDFTVDLRETKKKEGKHSYGKLSYKRMAEIIETVEEENAPAILDEFKRVKAKSKAHAGQYAYVKTWFLKRYKDVVNDEEVVA